jgi:hypothetical protein
LTQFPLAGIEALVNQAFVQDVYWLALSPVTRVGGLQLQELKAAGEVAADRVREAAGAPGIA